MDENHSESVTRAVSRRQLIRAGATGAAVAALPISASAQEDDATETSTSSSSNSTTTESESEPEPVLAQITEGVTLVDYEILDETADSVEWLVIVESTYPTQLVLSDTLGGLSSGGNVTRVEQDRRTITSGRTEARFTSGTYDDMAAIGVAVPGGAVNIGHGITEDEPLVTLPFGITLGASIFAAGTVYSAKKKQDGYRDEPEDVDPKDGWL